MTKPDHPAGIIETMLKSIEENNHRLDTLESKIDRIWELVSKMASPAEVKPEPICNKQPPLFDDDDSTTVEKDELEFQPIEDTRAEAEELSTPEIPFDDEVIEEAPEPEPEETKTAPSIPDWQEKEAFKKYTSDLIFEMKNKGMTLKGIAEELNGMGLKTRSGKDKWSFGMVNSILQQGEKG
ncbi:MAG: recombinase family protein [Desulfamplus sp.]|nr:recombinase family protein [Desulfamplus sp.]